MSRDCWENIQELTQLALADVVIAVEAEFRVVAIVERSLEERLCIVVIESWPEAADENELAARLTYAPSRWYVVILGAVVARTATTLARIVGLVLQVVEAAFEACDDAAVIINGCGQARTELGQKSDQKESTVPPCRKATVTVTTGPLRCLFFDR
ncbi:hypothetical protein C8J57DRAFT_1238109 [Mycena rebaudengoi]|nr:hypothetical protein C8J57DRAFT_1238109 [Mycena rebaudengoi]